jgi:hypothetical protein
MSAGLGGFAHALFDRGDIFLRNVAALDLVLEELKPEPRSPGVTLTFTRPNWPVPPDCFLWV